MRRRTVLATTGGLLTTGLAGCVATPEEADSTDAGGTPSDGPGATADTSAGTWPQIGYDARNTRHSPEATGPRTDAEITWTSFGDRPVYPPVVDDALYLTEGWTGGTAYALAAADGTTEWENTELPPMRWPPALHEDRLLVLSRTSENVVRLHALDIATGEVVWARQKGITASSGERPPIGPTVRGDTVYIASNRGIIACDARTGDRKWAAELAPHVIDVEDGPLWRTDWAKPAVTADRAFTFDMNDSHRQTREVYAVDRATGEPEWTAELELGDRWTLKGYVVAGGERIFVSALKLVARDGGTDGDADWQGAERLFAIEAETGRVAWDWRLPRKTLTPPAYADDTVYVGEWYPDADTGRLHALDAEDGSVQWTYSTQTGAVRSPVVAGETVYFGQGDELAAVDRADGSQLWQLSIGERIGPPVVVDGSLYVQTNPGHNNDSRVLAIQTP